MCTTPSRQFHHTAHTSAHLISCVGGATIPHNLTHFTPSLPFPWPHNHTGVVYLINCYGLTFDILPRPPRHLTGVKGQEGWGTHPPNITSPSRALQVKHGPTMPHPTGRKKTCINAHTHTAHRSWDTPTSSIRRNWLFFFSRDRHTMKNCPESVETCWIHPVGSYSAILACLVKVVTLATPTHVANIANEWLPCTNIWETPRVPYL